MTTKKQYLPDADSKALFKGLNQKKLKSVLEYLFSVKFPENCTIICIDTESNSVTGFEGKGYVKSDLIFQMLNDGAEVNPKIIIEFQTTKNNEMGYRLFIYSLNHSKVITIDGETYCEPAMCMTIYTTLDKPLYGVDKVKVKKYKYECVGLFKHKLIDTDDYYEFEYPFINILAMTNDDLEELDKDELDIFRVLYLYRYKKNNKLLLKSDFYEIARKTQDIVRKYNGEDLDALFPILQKLMRDIEDILRKRKNQNSKYGKVLDTMEAQGIYKEMELFRKMRLESEAIGEARGEARGKTQGINELIQKLLKTKSVEEVSSFLDMPIDYIKDVGTTERC